MRATFHDAARTPYAGQFVWLELDYDQPRNAAFLAAHPTGFPALFIIDPASDAVVDVWTGSATLAQVAEICGHALAGPASGADAALRRGDALLATGKPADARAAYREALAIGGAAWPARAHAIEQLIGASSDDPTTCVTAVLREADAVAGSHPFVSVALSGAMCLQRDSSARPAAERARVEALARTALELAETTEDEHYMLFEALHALRVQARDEAGARALAERYLAYAEARPASTSVDVRMARDHAKLRAAIKLGTPARVIPLLEATDRELADAPAAQRLATAYAAANRPADAIAATSRGLARAPGPHQTIALLVTRAGAEAQLRDAAAAARDLDAAAAELPRVPVESGRAYDASWIRAQRAKLLPE
jgi:tetratricopeptide (TPR) repeat protein